jgi:hypothetical protein
VALVTRNCAQNYLLVGGPLSCSRGRVGSGDEPLRNLASRRKFENGAIPDVILASILDLTRAVFSQYTCRGADFVVLALAILVANVRAYDGKERTDS